MTKRKPNKYHICRQVGENIWNLNVKNVKIDKTPGEHGKIHKKIKDLRYEPLFQTELREKQKFKKYYGELTESQFSKLFLNSLKSKGDTFDNIVSSFESRLMSLVFRSGLAKTIFQARQFINHGHIKVNGRIVTIPSYQVKPFSIISLSEEAKKLILNSSKKLEPVAYLETDYETGNTVFLRKVRLQEIPYGFELDLKSIIAYYSK